MFLHSVSAVRVTTFIAVALICISSFGLGATTLLPNEEVQALQDIGEALGKKWNFSVDPCSGQYGWITSLDDDAVICNCSYANNNTGVCHVVSITLRNQYLQGILPPELVQLPFLLNFDVSRNYIHGPIPRKWGAMPSILNITVRANSLTGSIPKELGNLSTLEILIVPMNELSGPLPQELGNLTQIKIMHFTSNKFTGELPSSFAKLVTMRHLRIGDNNFTGQIPDFIGNWIDLNILIMHASGFQGPIPRGIELLGNLIDLRISDLKGPEKQFPLLNSLSIQTLILRNCNLVGNLPEYLASRTSLTTLDVSFNKLAGVIPSSYSKLSDTEYIFLTGNQLTGTVPDWLSKGRNVDISYNNFTIQSSHSKCQVKNVNMFASSSEDNPSGIVTCLSDHCSKPRYYNLYINCGGGEVTVGGIKYNDDSDVGAPSRFFSNSSYHWGYSTTGYFPDDNKEYDAYTQANVSKLFIDNPQLYMNARLSPISLTYYAFCLINGNYTLSLHFAEIIFTEDKNYTSLGRRIFDVHIQGKVELKDFNIAAEAGGPGKEIVKKFTLMVTNNTLQIRLYWAGKGTVAIPYLSVYGPLISAISLNPNFIPPKESLSNGIADGVVVGIVVATICFVCLIMGVLWWKGCLGKKETMKEDLKGLDLKIGSFTLRQIKAATNNFDPANKIGEGGFGSVYKGILLDGTIIAVKQLSSKSKQGNREFLNEIGMISALKHPHLVKLYGCCIEGNQLMLVYEYMKNNSLAHALFGLEEHQLKLDWPTRHRICIGIARGLAYLHEESRLKIVHRDIKATNVLLDKDLLPKISDFGLAKLAEEDNTHISTRIAGTFGYMAPEYAMRGYLTDKADVYSFGIVALEIICGKCNTSSRQKDECLYLLDWANMLKEKGELIELIDPILGSNFNKEEAMTMINIALLCTNVSPAVRPAMSLVVNMLEGRIKVEASSPQAAVTIDEAKVVAMRKHFRGTLGEKVREKVIQSVPMDGPHIALSTSSNDSYIVNLDSDYLLHTD